MIWSTDRISWFADQLIKLISILTDQLIKFLKKCSKNFFETKTFFEWSDQSIFQIKSWLPINSWLATNTLFATDSLLATYFICNRFFIRDILYWRSRRIERLELLLKTICIIILNYPYCCTIMNSTHCNVTKAKMLIFVSQLWKILESIVISYVDAG